MSSQTDNASPRHEPTPEEEAAVYSSCFGGVFTVVAVILIMFLIDSANSNLKFSIQSIAVVDSSATWHVDFLVKTPPSSRYSIYYDGDVVLAVRLGSLNAAVLNISHHHKHSSRSGRLAAFSLAFVAEGDGNGVVELDIELRGKHKGYGYVTFDEAGLFDIKCQNLITPRSHENIQKIKCKSSFVPFTWF